MPRTIENTREPDETVCRPDDEEVRPFACFAFSDDILFGTRMFLCPWNQGV